MKPPIKNILMSIALSMACVALAGCGNKGPLVKPSDIPAATTPAVAPAGDAATDPASTPAEEPASGTPAARR